MPADPELARAYPTRPEALAAYWALSRRLALEVRELKALRTYIRQRWGRCPRLPVLGLREEEHTP